ncbi:MAG TPA: cytochrome c peroxidase [Polyangiaceae bacterium]|nr:cytochrome c peroxidase [Polyangiaceae bacterium]
MSRFVRLFFTCCLLCVTTPLRAADEATLVALGRALFVDTELSSPRGTSCASCHDPARAFSGTNGSTLGVPRGSRAGHFARRSAPSLLYLKYVPSFRFVQTGDDPGLSPTGGFFWDGRADSIRTLTRQPLLNPDEMNVAGGGALAATLRQRPYGAEFEAAFPRALADPEATLGAVGEAVEAFLTADDMAPFSSRFDDFVRGTTRLTPDELRGLALFKDATKGGCAGCHQVDDASHDPTRSLFTDFGFDAPGVPANPRLPPGRNPDLGLCERADPLTSTSEPRYCVNFRTPSLRNVAVRPSFMHNGAFTSLRAVVAFYATRDTNPKRWYPSGVRFDGVPAEFRRQINVTTPPYDRRPGDPPALDDAEIDAIVSFLKTLTDAKVAKP